MNDFFAPLYEFYFNWDNYQQLLNYVYNNLDYGKIGWVLLLPPIVILFIFYKVWEPMRNQRLMWFITLFLISIIAYAGTTWILYQNNDIMQYIGNYTGDEGPDGDYFIVQMSLISILYTIVITFLYSLVVKRFSTHNSHNPF